MDSKYSVPIIPQNLYKHETIVQIADVLDHLSNITEGIFSQVNKRLESNTEKLADISRRVDIVNDKINTLKGAKKATQVFSSSKYPAENVCKEYVSIFHDSPHIEMKRHQIKIKNIPTVHEPLEKLQFFHVNISNHHEKKMEGLGDIPQSLDFVNDLLLYNSGKNLYKNFVISDALKTGSHQHIREADENISEIGAAPHSISQRSTLMRSHTTQNYFYTPQIGEVPALDVPLDLPDLPGIADDLHYDSELGPGIAPSADITQSIIELEIESNNLPTITQNETEPEKGDIPITKLPPLPPPPPVELPKPPPEPVKIPVEDEEDVQKPPEDVTIRNVVPLPQDDIRSSLMEAIRSAGGTQKAKLKSVRETETQSVKAPQGGDLMADLHNKLFMRRKGISGAKQSQENAVDADSTLARISAMIPPPDPKNEVDSTSNDEDWEE